MDIQGALGRKVGPLPVWVYGAVAVLAAYVYVWYSGRLGSDSTQNAGAPSDVASDSFGTVGDAVSGSTNTSGGTTSTTGGTDAPSDNYSWLARATAYLVAYNYDPLTVSNTLTKYLQGEQLTIAERALVGMAIARFGVPPEGAPVSPGVPPTPPTYPPTPGGTPRGGTSLPRRDNTTTVNVGGVNVPDYGGMIGSGLTTRQGSSQTGSQTLPVRSTQPTFPPRR